MRNDIGAERLSNNVTSLLITSAVVDSPEELSIERISAGDAVLFGTTGSARMVEVDINRFDCRGANLAAIGFDRCFTSVLVVDDHTLFGQTRPVVGSLMVETAGKTSVLYNPAEIDAWISAHQAHLGKSEVENEATRLLERVARVFLRQFFMKSDPLDPVGRYLSDGLWPAIEEKLALAGRLRRTDRKDASGKRGEFIHIINPGALLERTSHEDREIWDSVAELVQ
jgi:hypothetical protein